MSNNMYTDMQLKIISGEIPLETVDGRAIWRLYKKALELDDGEIAARAQERLEQLKSEAVEKNRERVNNRNSLKKLGEFQWKQPTLNEYSEHQKKVVRGEIPLENVHTKELINIHLKAHNVGDYELSERFGDLITTRKIEAKEKKKARDIEYSKTHSKLYKKIKNSKITEQIEDGTALTKLEQGILMGVIDLDECSEEQLEHILQVVQAEKDEFKILLAKNLLLYKKDPKAIYTVRDKNEALDMLEELLGLPIRRPESWFC